MKKNDWLLVVITGIYSFLFYGEMLGLNLGLFTLVIIFSLILKDKKVLENKNWIIVALGCVLSAFSVCYYGNLLSIITNYISLLILLGMNLNPKSSVLFSLIYGVHSIVISPSEMVKEIQDRRNHSEKIKIYKRKLFIVIPIVIAYVFFLMYKNSNPIFASYANKINFKWISWGWVFFTLIAFIMLFGGINSKKIQKMANVDETDILDIDPNTKTSLVLFGKTILVDDEYFTGKILFILLNILIFFLNVFDINFLFINDTLPDGVVFADILHQGVGMLVISIALSILIILFYFRGELNLFSNNRTFKFLAYTWIFQNLIMLFTVVMKNNMYIEQYGLTYKRIGIFIYAVLTFIGLVTTTIKLYKVKKNIFLVRFNGWTFYFVLLISCMINWDRMIIECDQEGQKQYDVYYLLSLPSSNIPLLIEFEKNISNNENKAILKKYLPRKIKEFTRYYHKKSWKSWNYQDQKVQETIDAPVNFDTLSYRRKLSLTGVSHLSR